jgi:hypothetical protein
MACIKLAAGLAAAGLLVGCASTSDFYLRQLEASGVVRIDISEVPGYDYKALIRNVIDLNWSGDEPADRRKVVAAMLTAQCNGIEVVDEQPLDTGAYLGGRRSITWVMRVKCLR